MLNQPLVSIVMTTYNGQSFLEEQLESILAQEHSHFELIICDDCSTDGTVAILESYSNKDKRITVYRNISNLGVNRNFEQGLLKATGELIAFADQDDVWRPDKLSEQLRLFVAEEIVLVHSASSVFSKTINEEKKLATVSHPMTGNDTRRLLLRNSISGHNMMFRKKLRDYIVPVPDSLYYDWWISITATCIGEIAATNKILAYQRSHGKNITVQERKTKKQTLAEFNERKKALEAFITIRQMNPGYVTFAKRLYLHLLSLNNRRFSISYFIFLLRNAEVLFFYKKAGIPFLAHLKTAYRMSFTVDV